MDEYAPADARVGSTPLLRISAVNTSSPSSASPSSAATERSSEVVKDCSRLRETACAAVVDIIAGAACRDEEREKGSLDFFAKRSLGWGSFNVACVVFVAVRDNG